MKTWFGLVVCLLLCSLALNVYLLTNNDPASHNPQEANLPSSTAWADNVKSATTLSAKNHAQTDISIPSSATTKAEQHRQASRAEKLTQANQWLDTNSWPELESFLQDYLKLHPQDMDFLLIEAKLKVETHLLSDAIAHYYDLLRFPMTTAQAQFIQSQIQQLTSNTIKQLSHNYSWDVLARFVEPLLQLEPNKRLYILSLAKAYAELQQISLMENVLASIDYQDPDAQRIRASLAVNNPNQADEATANSEVASSQSKRYSIPLKQYGDHYVVQASLSNNSVELLIDTGASITAISRAYFASLSNRYKINYLGRFNMSTAGGDVMARMYQFAELNVQGVKVENLPVVILPLTGLEHADGLLGMNFLREFDFKIDQNQPSLLLQ